MLDIISMNYGVLPCEISKLSWYDLSICIAAIRTRSERVSRMIKKSTSKKGTVFPTVNITDLANML